MADRLKVTGTARIDGAYRYSLWRMWGEANGPYVLFCMLNPSTADALEDDPTIRRCIGFAQRWNMSRLCVVNLYAFRATDPADLFKAADPIGPYNDTWLHTEARQASKLVVAWGSKALPAREKAVTQLLKAYGPLYCLRLTKDGHPGHPLYLPNNSELIPFEVPK